jgi:hypothetical protein
VIRLHALAGRKEEARHALEELRRTAVERKTVIVPEHLAYMEIALGNLDQGMALLEDAVRDHDPALLWVAVDPRVDPVRPMPQFASLLARLRLPDTRPQLP